MKNYSPITLLTSKCEVMLIDKYGLTTKPKCDFLTESALCRLAELEIKIAKGEIDYVVDKDNEIARLTAENERLIKQLTDGKCVYLSDSETAEGCVQSPCPNYKTVEDILKENAELHARLEKAVELPCKVGDKVYGIGYTDCSLQHAKTEQEKQKISKFCYKMNGRCDKCKYSIPAIEEFVCTQIQIGDCGIDGVDVLVVGDKCENYLAKNIRKTPEEAEARLSELKGGEVE